LPSRSECGSSSQRNIGTDVDESTNQAPLAIKLTDARLTYRSYENSNFRLQDAVRSRSFRRRVKREIPALKGVNLDIRVGESVAIIGHNGAGKSSLLRAIAGLQPLDSGSLAVSSPPRLLGVQAMLSSSWSGRESIQTGLIALGLSRREAFERVEAVGRFARLTDVLDLPVSTYSSGMRARLYFAISTELGGDILLIDEALAAGDKSFRSAARERLRERLAQSRTLVLVSHSMETVKELCQRAVLLADGRIIDDGDVKGVIRKYEDVSH